MVFTHTSLLNGTVPDLQKVTDYSTFFFPLARHYSVMALAIFCQDSLRFSSFDRGKFEAVT